MSIFLGILISGILLVGGYYLGEFLYDVLEWNVHIRMTKRYAKENKHKIAKGDFNTFHANMAARTWGRKLDYPTAFFTPLDLEKTQREISLASDLEDEVRIIEEYNQKVDTFMDNYVHADIICFDKTCLKLEYKSFKKYKQFLEYYKAESYDSDWRLTDYE